jgi:hypothetical protein
MAYTKTTWQDRVVETPRRFKPIENADGTLDLIAAPGKVAQEGTPVNAARMNKIETGIADSIPKGAASDEVVFVKSLLHDTSSRVAKLTRNELGEVVEINEYSDSTGSTLVQSTVIARVDGLVSTITQNAGKVRMKYTIERDAQSAITGVGKRRLV